MKLGNKASSGIAHRVALDAADKAGRGWEEEEEETDEEVDKEDSGGV